MSSPRRSNALGMHNGNRTYDARAFGSNAHAHWREQKGALTWAMGEKSTGGDKCISNMSYVLTTAAMAQIHPHKDK